MSHKAAPVFAFAVAASGLAVAAAGLTSSRTLTTVANIAGQAAVTQGGLIQEQQLYPDYVTPIHITVGGTAAAGTYQAHWWPSAAAGVTEWRVLLDTAGST